MGQANTAGLTHPSSYPPTVIAEGIKRMMQMQYVVAAFVTLMPIIVTWVFWGDIPAFWLLAWCALSISNQIGQYLLPRRYLKGPHEPARAIYFAQLYTTWLALPFGFIWGLAGMMMLWATSVSQQMLILGIIMGIPAGALPFSSYWPKLMYALVIPCISMTAIALGIKGDAGSLGLAAVLLFIYIPIVVYMTKITHRVLFNGIQLQFENTDLVERLRDEKEKAEAASRDKTRFLASASHDLRQPVHALTLFADALQPRVHDVQGKTLLHNMGRSIDVLNQLLESLLDISKLDANIIKPNFEHFLLRPLLDAISTEYLPQAQGKGLVWQLTMDEDFVVCSDKALFGSMLRNLVSNAIRYTRSGGVFISCSRQSDEVRVEIRDTGVGIAKDHHQEIFREFYQLSNSERDRSKGLGLGLAIVDRLAKLLLHRIEMTSEVGIGSSFSIVLTAGNIALIQNTDTLTSYSGQRDEQGMRVLVIDDEESVREGMQAVLERWGCTVILSESVEEAANKIGDSAPPHIFIVDYRLRDGKTGAQAIEYLRNVYGSDIPALIITGDTSPDRLQEAHDSGHTLMHKPVQPAKLRAYLRRVQRRKT